MKLSDLSEEEINKIKNQLIENGTIFQKKKKLSYDTKFFETVTISNILIKFFLFFTLGIYAIINLIGFVLSILYNNNTKIVTVIGVSAICFIVFAIFRNINTNKNKEEFAIYVKDDNFIFNYCNDVLSTPDLFYSLPYDSIKKIEFLIYTLRKKDIYGSVTFTFTVCGYDISYIIRFTNLTNIQKLLKSKFPSLLKNLIIDGKSIYLTEPRKNKHKLKFILISLTTLVMSVLLFIIPYILNYHSIALIISSIVLFITAINIFLSCYIYTFYLVQGIIISSVFIIIGFCVPLFIIENSGIAFMNFVILNNEVLMPTVFGIIGVCIYSYIINIIISKIYYILKSKRELDLKAGSYEQ